MERQTERFRDCEALKERSFTSRYWSKFMSRHGLDFSTRKSDQKNFSDTEIENFRKDMNQKLMFYTIDQLLNFDESGVFWNQMHGRIIVKKGTVKVEPKLHLVHHEHKKYNMST